MDRYVIFHHIIPSHFLSLPIKLSGGDFIPVIQSEKVCAIEPIPTDIHKELDTLDGWYFPYNLASRVVGWYADGPSPIPMTAHG